VKWNNEGSFLNDAHKDLKADYIIANPFFNVSEKGRIDFQNQWLSYICKALIEDGNLLM
jgi:type I restriction-modification system DNA methylase subunit